MFFFISFLLFSGAFFGTAYYVWSVPRKAAATDLDLRLRGVRSTTRTTSRTASDLVTRERRGAFAALGDFVSWLGVVARLQVFIQQANLSWRAADVVAISLAIALLTYLILSLFVPILI